MAKPKLYFIEISPSSRAVLLTAKALNLDLELIPCNTLVGEHLTPEFIALNPQHSVPTLVDGDVVIWDSHAICTYLATQYATAGKPALCPTTDYGQRARLDQRLHFNQGTLFARYYAAISPVFRLGATHSGDADQLASIREALGFLEAFLDGEDYLIGDAISVADIACVTTVSSIATVLEMDLTPYKRVSGWLARMAAELPHYAEIEERAVKIMRETLLQFLDQNRTKA